MKSFIWNDVCFELESREYFGQSKHYLDSYFKAKENLYCLIKDYSGLIDCIILGITFEGSRIQKGSDNFSFYHNLDLNKDIKTYRSYAIRNNSLFLITKDYTKIENFLLLG